MSIKFHKVPQVLGGGGGVYDKFIYLRNIQTIPKVLLVATLFISDGAC